MGRGIGVSAGALGFVLLGAAALLFLVTQITRNRPTLVSRPTYAVTARFENIADLKVGAHVAMSGVNVGRVTRIDFDAVEHEAVVEMRLDAAYDHIPRDSSASITTQGILGGKLISVTGGSADVFLADHGRFLSTRSAIPLENLISRLVVRYLKQPAKASPQGPRTD